MRSPSHESVLRTGGGGSRRPEPFIQLGSHSGVCCDPFRVESLENYEPEVFACARPPANGCNSFRIRRPAGLNFIRLSIYRWHNRQQRRLRDARLVGSAGASPSHGPSVGREGEAPADPSPSFNLDLTAEFAAIPSGSNLLKIMNRRCSLALDLRLMAVILSG